MPWQSSQNPDTHPTGMFFLFLLIFSPKLVLKDSKISYKMKHESEIVVLLQPLLSEHAT